MKRLGWVGMFVLGCTLGVRAEGAFETEQPLGDVQAVALDLPSTPVSVLGCDRAVEASCPDALQLSGRWHAVGGSASQARHNAGRPSLTFDPYGGLMRVSADVPFDVEGLVDLELDAVGIPGDVDIEVRTSLGDVAVRSMTSAVLVDTAVGDVDVRGEMRSTGVHVGEGQVVVVGPGPIEVHADDGGVRIEQTAGAAEATVVAPLGGVELLLGGDSDVDLRVHTRGRIRVQTDAFSAATTGLYRARSGSGTFRIDIEAGGDVAIRLRG